METNDLSGYNPAFLERNRAILEAEGLAELPGMPVDPSKPPVADVRSESALQKLCESWLTRRGYLRLTPVNAEKVAQEILNDPTAVDKHPGWFGHWTQNQRNPLTADLVIHEFLNKRGALHIELKVNERYQPGQEALCAIGFWVLCKTFEHFTDALDAWETTDDG